MPLPIAHGVVGASLVALVHPKADFENWKPLLYGFLLANSPDLDFGLNILFGGANFHRGFSHSLVFAAIVGAAFFVWLRRENQRIPLAYWLAFLSHILLDAAGAKGGGVRLLTPFDNTAFGLGLISLSELKRGFLIVDMLYFSLIEAVIFVPILAAVLMLKRIAK